MIAAFLIAIASVTPGVRDEHYSRVRDPHYKRPRCNHRATASVYGRGDNQLGNTTASGRVYHRHTLGVAHKTLRLGTRVTLCYRGRRVTARVIDRGPYVRGRDFDLMLEVQRRLHFPSGVAGLRWRFAG